MRKEATTRWPDERRSGAMWLFAVVVVFLAGLALVETRRARRGH